MAKVTKTAKSKTTAKKPVKKSTEKDSLASELKSLIPKLDEEGLAFLVKQAHVHLYNMQVDALNQTMIKDEQRKSKTVSKTKPQKTAGNGRFIDIKISETGSGYHILCNNEWIAFTVKEITAMVKIVKGEGSDLEIRERLYNWLSRERGDLLITASIANKFDDKLTSLINLLNKNFKLKK
jgi:uncharacterized protein YjaZ